MLGFGIALFSVLATYLQSRATEQALRLTVAQQRPYVAFQDIGVERSLAPGAPGGEANALFFIVRIHIHNTGSTPATGLTFDWVMLPQLQGTPAPTREVFFGEMAKLSSPETKPGFLMPGEIRSSNSPAYPAADIEAFMKGAKDLYLSALVRYSGASGDPRPGYQTLGIWKASRSPTKPGVIDWVWLDGSAE